MKKIIYLLTVCTLVFSACTPLEDVYKELDAESAENPIVGDAVITLTDDDYEALKLENSYFNNVDDAKEMLPDFIKELYPVWGSGSSVLVNYELESGTDLEEVAKFVSATQYTLSNDDYASTGSDAFGFYPDVTPVDLIPNVLNTQITTPEEGQVVLAKYKQYTETPIVGLANVVEYNFADSLQGWEIIDVLGDEGWTSSLSYVQGNGYSGGQKANEDWLISPQIDLTSESNLKFQIDQVVKYATDFSLLKILVSKDYTGDQTTANWDEIDLVPTENGNDFILSEDYDFSDYDGQKINIALKYTSTDSDAGRWRIKNIFIKTLGVTGNTDSKGEYFIYENGAWSAAPKTYYLSASDYDSMGEESGQPGRYNNFSSSVAMNDYIPAFLSIKYPYAQEEDAMYIYAKYYNGTTIIRGNQFTFTNGKWVPHNTQLQFGFENNKWVPDNTIKYTLTNADFELVGNGQYHNFDVRPGKDEADEEVRLDKINTILLNNFPQYGEGQKFSVSYAVWKPGDDVFVMNVIHNGTRYVLQE